MADGFIKIARTDEIGMGAMRCLRIDERPILVANVGGLYYAVSATCSHEEVSLCTGALKGEIVKCPLHGSRFDLRTGTPLEGPAEQPLAVYPVRLDGDDILVDLPPTP